MAHFQRGLAAREGRPVDKEIAALLVGLGRAQEKLGKSEESASDLLLAFDYYESVGDGAHAAAITEHQIGAANANPSAWLDVMDRALRLVPPDSLEAARVLSRRTLVAAVQGNDYVQAWQGFRRVLEITRREGDAFLEMWTLERASHIARLYLRWQEALDLALQAVRLAGSVSNPAAEITAHCHVACEMLRRGDLARARSHATQALQRSEHTRQRWDFPLWACVQVALAEGDLLAASRLLERSQRVDARSLDWVLPGLQAHIEAYVSGAEVSRPHLERFVGALVEREGQPHLIMPWALFFECIPPIARITGDFGPLTCVAKLARAELASREALPLEVLLSRIVLGMVAVQQGDAREAGTQYKELLPHAGHGISRIGHPTRPRAGLAGGDDGGTGPRRRAFRARAGFCPQGRLPAGAGLDLLRLCRPAAPARRPWRRREGSGPAGRGAGPGPGDGHAAAGGAGAGAAQVILRQSDAPSLWPR